MVTDISQGLMYELMKRIQSDLVALKDGQRDMRQDIVSLRNHMHVMAKGTSTTCTAAWHRY